MESQFEPGDYVDVQNADRVWYSACISELNPAKGLRIDYLRAGSKFTDWVDANSPRLAAFRLRTKCGEELEFLPVAVDVEKVQEMMTCVLDAQETMFTSQGCKEIVNFVRGTIYRFAMSLLSETAKSRQQFEAGVSLLQGTVSLAGAWVARFPSMVREVGELKTHPELIYSSPQYAAASCYPELFRVVSCLLGSSSLALPFLHVPVTQNSHATAYCAEQNLGDLTEFFWREGVEGLLVETVGKWSSQGFQEESLTTALCVLEQMPFWAFIGAHYSQVFQSANCGALLQVLWQCLLSPTSDYAEQTEIPRLWEMAFAGYQLLCSLGYPNEAKRLLSAALGVVLQVAGGKSLERRVSVMNLLQSLADRAMQAENAEFSQLLAEWANDSQLCAVLLSDLHAEVLRRGRVFWQWLQGCQLLPTECLKSLVQQAQGAHESLRDATHDLVVSVAPYFRDEHFAALGEALPQRFDAPLLSLLKRLLETANLSSPGALQFAESVLDALQRLVFEETVEDGLLQCAVQTCADILRIGRFKSRAPEYFHRAFSLFFDGEQEVPPHVLLTLLNSVKEDQSTLNTILNDFQRDKGYSFPNGLKRCMERCINSAQSHQLSVLFTCLDTAGCATTDYATKQSKISRQELLDIVAFVAAAEEATVREDLMAFLAECAKGSLWFTPDFALQVIKWMSTQPAASFVRELTIPQYEHICTLVVHANAEGFTKHKDAVCCLTRGVLSGLAELVYIAANALDEEVHSAAIAHINVFLTRIENADNASLVRTFVRAVSDGVSRPDAQVIARSLTCLKRVMEYHEKYQDLCWTDEELQARTEECLKEAGIEEQYREEAEIFFKNQIVAYAVEHDVRYMQVKFVAPEAQTGVLDLNIMKLPYVAVDVSFLMDEEAMVDQLITALGNHSLRIGELVVWVVRKLIHRSRRYANVERLAADYDDCFRGKIDKRIVNLIALCELSKSQSFIEKYRSRRMDLLTELTKISTNQARNIDAIETHRQRVLIHYELLFALVDIHFVQQRNFLTTPQLTEAMGCLFLVAQYYCSPTTDKTYEPLLIQNIGNLMITTLTVSRDADALASGFNFQSFCHSALIESRCVVFAAAVADLIRRLCAEDPQFIGHFVQILLGQSAEAETHMEEQYYSLLGDLLAQYQPDSTEPWQQLKASIMRLLPASTGQLSGKLWKVVTGLAPLFTLEEACGLLQEATSAFFFYEEPHPQAASAHNRKELLTAIQRLYRQFSPTDEMSEVLRYVNQVHSMPGWRRPDNWSISMDYADKGEYRGLKNQGATCYMNSIFQQLFAVDRFVHAVLGVEAGESQLVRDFQRLMADLKFKSTGVVSAEAILYSLDPFEPINPMEQADIEEFFGKLMSRLENEMGAERFSPLRDVMIGRIARTIKGKGTCTHVRSTPESFLTIPLELKKKRNLQESLNSFTSAETLAGGNMIECEVCRQKVQSESITQLLHLPNVLCFSLRRFGFNIEQGRRYKLNDRYEFPMNVNLSAQSIASVADDSYYEYSLKGVVVHVGSAEAGHYYSLARVGDRWFKFDDTVVSPFNVEEMPKEAFGGRSRDGQMEKSAYLIFYARERFFAYPQVADEPVVQLPPLGDLSLCPEVAELKQQEEVQQSMTRLLRHVMSEEYLAFVLDLLNFDSHKAGVFALSYFLTVHCRKSNWATGKDTLSAVLVAVRQTPTLGGWLAEVVTFSPLLTEVLVSAPLGTKKAVVLLFREMLQYASEEECTLILTRLINKLEELQEITSSTYSQFFELLAYVVQKAPKAAIGLRLCERIVSRLISRNPSTYPPALPAAAQTYEAEAYLGHPLPDYLTPVVCAKETDVSFQLLVINMLKHMSLDACRSLQENIHLMAADVVLAHSEFEQAQALELLVSGEYDISSLAARIYTSYGEITKTTELRFLTFTVEILKRKDDALLDLFLHLLLDSDLQLERNCWYWLLLAVFGGFPQAAAWRNQGTRDKVQEKMLTLELESKLETVFEGFDRGLKAQPLPAKRLSTYGEALQLNTKVAVEGAGGQPDKGTVLKSMKLAHLVKFEKSPEPRWVSAESDIELL